eukprot:Gb_05704 [translate_table: standard]
MQFSSLRARIQSKAKSEGEEVKIGLSHIHGTCSPLRPLNSSRSDMVLERLERHESHVNSIKFRIATEINSEGANLPLQSAGKHYIGNYIVTAGFGTPAKKFSLTIDTGSDLSWMQCPPCSDPDACYSQADPIFNPKQSSSYKRLGCLSSQCRTLAGSAGSLCSTSGCAYKILYGDGSISEGDLSQDTLTLPSDSFPNFTFGCGHNNKVSFGPSAGLLGLSRNPLSFPSQMASKYGGQFSYCLPRLQFSRGIRLIEFRPSVGGERLSLPAGLFRPTLEGGGGTIIDSGTVITHLKQPAYDAFRKKTTHLPSADPYMSFLDTCYNLAGYTQVQIPTITFHFEGNANVDVSSIGILVPLTYVCLAFASSSTGLAFSIIGNF